MLAMSGIPISKGLIDFTGPVKSLLDDLKRPDARNCAGTSQPRRAKGCWTSNRSNSLATEGKQTRRSWHPCGEVIVCCCSSMLHATPIVSGLGRLCRCEEWENYDTAEEREAAFNDQRRQCLCGTFSSLGIGLSLQSASVILLLNESGDPVAN